MAEPLLSIVLTRTSYVEYHPRNLNEVNYKMSKANNTLQIAVGLAEKHGYRHITRDMIADKAGVATGTVSLHLGTMDQMRKKLVRHAVRTGNKKIISQAIVARDPYVLRKIPKIERENIMARMA